MPCNSDYLEATPFEIAASRVMALHDELDGKEIQSKSWWGNCDCEYCKRIGKDFLDSEVSRLCSRINALADVTQYSLELQMWWRDHQAADIAREKQEAFEAKKQQIRESGLAKLTDEEKEALGL